MAHVYAARAVLPGMLARGRGYLLNTASAAGLLASPGDAPYTVSKHGAVALAEWLAITYGDRGIGVSVLCPMGVATPLLMDAARGGRTRRPGGRGLRGDLDRRAGRRGGGRGAGCGAVPDPAAPAGRYVLGAEGRRSGPLARRACAACVDRPATERDSTWLECRTGWRWSPVARRASAPRSRGGSPPTAPGSAVLDLQQDAAQAVADEITAGRRPARSGSAPTSRKRDQVQAAVDRLVGEFGGLHILVNNAGVLRDNLLFKMTDDDWTLVMERAPARRVPVQPDRAEAHGRGASTAGSCRMSSTSALGNRGQANYSTAKAGLQGFTKTLAIELGPFGVTANAIAPGFIETAMTKATAERIGTTIEQMREAVAATVPVRRGGRARRHRQHGRVLRRRGGRLRHRPGASTSTAAAACSERTALLLGGT